MRDAASPPCPVADRCAARQLVRSRTPRQCVTCCYSNCRTIGLKLPEGAARRGGQLPQAAFAKTSSYMQVLACGERFGCPESETVPQRVGEASIAECWLSFLKGWCARAAVERARRNVLERSGSVLHSAVITSV